MIARARGRRATALIFTTFLLTGAAVPAWAATKTWSATPADANWNNPSNWAGGVVPANNDDIVFPAASTIQATNNDIASLTVNSITFNAGGYSIAGNGLSINGAGLTCVGGTSTFTAPLTMAAAMTISVSGGCEIDMQSALGGSFGFTMSGLGDVFLEAANTFSGAVTVNSGLLVISQATGLGTGDGTPATGTTVNSGGALKMFLSAVVSNEWLSLSGTGVGGGFGAFYNNSTSTWAGPVVLPATATLHPFSAMTFSGVISGAGGINHTGPSSLILTNTNTFLGATTLSGASGSALVLNGAITGSGGVTANSGTIFAGSGSTSGPASILAGGAMSPGTSPGILSTANLSFAAGSTFNVELNGTTVGSQYDQVNVTGSVSLGGATLNPTLGFSPAGGTQFLIVNNDGADPISGTFAGLAQGASLLINGVPFTISYTGGDGNDVVLTATAAVPSAPITLLLFLAAGLLAIALRTLGTPEPRTHSKF